MLLDTSFLDQGIASLLWQYLGLDDMIGLELDRLDAEDYNSIIWKSHRHRHKRWLAHITNCRGSQTSQAPFLNQFQGWSNSHPLVFMGLCVGPAHTKTGPSNVDPSRLKGGYIDGIHPNRIRSPSHSERSTDYPHWVHFGWSGLLLGSWSGSTLLDHRVGIGNKKVSRYWLWQLMDGWMILMKVFVSQMVMVGNSVEHTPQEITEMDLYSLCKAGCWGNWDCVYTGTKNLLLFYSHLT